MTTAETLTFPPAHCVWPVAAQLGESPLWSPRQQALYFVDILGRAMHRYRPADGERRSWAFDEEISAVCERREGPELLLSLRHDLVLFHPENGTLQRLHRPEPARADNRFNDGKCDAAGRWWVGSMDMEEKAHSGALYRFHADGRCDRVRDGLLIGNGPAWSLDGQHMFFNETSALRTVRHAFDVHTGTLGGAETWIEHQQADGAPDGITTDSAGRLWIARFGGSAVSCHASDGRLLGRVVLPTSQVTSVCFGGPALRTLYVTTARKDLDDQQLATQRDAGGLFAIDLHTSGLPAAQYAG